MVRCLALLFPLMLVAVEAGPVPVVRVHDGDTLTVLLDGQEERVRLLYVDTPETSGDAAMPEGDRAAAYLAALLPPGRMVKLTAPGDTWERDRGGQRLAIVECSLLLRVKVSDADGALLSDHGYPAQFFLITMGHSVYWKKHGAAPVLWDQTLEEAETMARALQAGAWGTAAGWMRDKASERAAPKAADTAAGEPP